MFEPDFEEIENWDELNLLIKEKEDQILKYEKIQSFLDQVGKMNYPHATLNKLDEYFLDPQILFKKLILNKN